MLIQFLVGQFIHLFAQAKKESKEYDQKYYSGMRLYGEQKYEQAITVFKKIIEENPSFPKTYYKLILAYKQIERLDEAAQYFQSLLTNNPGNGYFFYGIGMVDKLKGNFLSAQNNIIKAVELSTNYPSIYKNLVDVYHKLDQLKKAEEFINEQIGMNPKDAAAYYGLAYLFQIKKEWENAHKYYEKVTELNSDILEAYEKKGVLYYYAGNIHKFLELSLEGLKIAEDKNDLEFKAKFLSNAAVASINLSKYSEAEKYFKEALKLNHDFGKKQEQERILINLGVIYRDTQKYTDALNSFNKALKMAHVLNDKNGEATCYRNIGSVYHFMSDFENALEYFEIALPIVNEIEDMSLKALVLWSMGASSYALGNLSISLDYYISAYQVAVELSDKRNQGRYLNSMGLVLWNLGKYSQALTNYEKALVIAKEINDKTTQSYCLGNMAIIYGILSEDSKALEYDHQALQIAREIGDQSEEGRLLGNIAVTYHELKNYEKALIHYQQALKLNREIGNKRDEVTFLGNLANLYYDMGYYESVNEYLQQALDLSRKINFKTGEANTLLKKGEINYILENYDTSLRSCQKALDIGNRMKDAQIIWEAHAGLAMVFEKQGKHLESISNYRLAIDKIEGMRTNLQTGEFKAGFLEKKLGVYEKLINFLVELDQQYPQKKYALQAFQINEKARARAFLDLLVESRSNIKSGIDPKLKKKERDIFKQISDIQTGLQNANLAEKKWEELTGELQKAENSLELIKREIRRTNDKYANLIYPQPYNLAQVRQILDNKTALLEFFLGEKNSFVWVITRDNSVLSKLPGRKELEKDVREYLVTISKPVSLSNPLAKHYVLGFQLYSKLFENLSGLFKDKSHLIIIPDDILYFLPFESLICQKVTSRESAKYLLQDYTISYAPSSSILCYLKNEKRKINKKRKQLLAFGDPYFDKTIEIAVVRGEEPEKITDDSTAMFAESEAEANLTRGLYEKRGFTFKRLPYSGTEVSEIGNSFPDAEKVIYLGERAREEAVKDEDLSKYKYIHFATHGIIDQEIASRSGIVLTLDDDPTEDGFLQMNEILNLNLDADLVTLSACQTGLGRLRKGEGIVGLTRAFIYAGTPSVVVSLWKINDRSTAKYMKGFYGFLKKGNGTAESLRLSKLEMLKSKRKLYQHPFYWAPFVVIGSTK